MEKKRSPLLAGIGLLTTLFPSSFLFRVPDIHYFSPYFYVPLVIGIGCAAAGCVKRAVPAKGRATKIGLILCLISTVLPFTIDWKGKPIRIVLPVSFRGEFSIVKDRTSGQELKLQDGVWVFEIPASGVLFVKEDYPFFMWHNMRYAYSDGRPLSRRSVEEFGLAAADPSPGYPESDGTTHRWKVDAPH